MSSSKVPDSEHTPGGQSPAEQESSGEGGPEEETVTPSEASIETVECPNCDHVFTGNYCPQCGQEADPSVSATGVVGGFFRELVDVEHGFWPTFVGLTLHPGKTLQQYLSGVRQGLVSPGRYLLAAVVATVGANQLSRWIGVKPTPVNDPYMRTADGRRDAFDASLRYYNSVVEQAPILSYLLMAVPLALSLWTLFRGRFSGKAEALAVGSFLLGHAAFLIAGIDLAYAGAGYLLTGPSIGLPALAVVVFTAAYVGVACWGCFGPGWKPAAKGAFGGAWAYAEGVAIVGIVLAGSTFWLCRVDPSAYYVFSPEEPQIWGSLIIAGAFSVPLLLHAGVEVYSRYR